MARVCEALAIATGEWQSIESTSRAMRDSYVMAKHAADRRWNW